jgi:hypothetical protein
MKTNIENKLEALGFKDVLIIRIENMQLKMLDHNLSIRKFLTRVSNKGLQLKVK